MITRILAQSDPATLPVAVNIIKTGEVVAFPTDTVYGIGAMASSPEAIDRLYQIKGRSFDKPIPILIGSIDQLDLIVSVLPPTVKLLAKRFWPGPLTMVMLKKTGLPDNLTSLPTVGVRIPNHKFALDLLNICGPLAVTSANLSGRGEAQTVSQVMEQLGGNLELIVDGGSSTGGIASTVVDLSGTHPIIIRQGPITQKMITEAL